MWEFDFSSNEMVRFDAVVWVRFGSVETVEVRQVMWLVMLESAKHRILGVDTLKQPVSPRVWYEITFLLIRGDVRSVPCLDEWKVTW
jgi:hypothetical protein